MSSYLLTWNPALWTWPTFENDLRQFEKTQRFDQRWSCGNTKRISKGDQVFLLRLGTQPKGIIGRGIVTKESFVAEHWDEKRASSGDTTNYVEFNFDWLVHYNSDDIISLDFLTNDAYMSGQMWTPQNSGISIQKRVPPHLNQLIDGVKAVEVINQLTREQLIDGFKRFEAGEPHSFGASTDYDVVFESMRYAPKAIVGLAASNIVGRVLQPREFGAGHGSACFRSLERNRFNIVPKLPIHEIKDEIEKAHKYREGKLLSHVRTYYERDASARRKCIEYFGFACQVCNMDFGSMYGEIGSGFIHVHHIVPISSIGESYEIDPIADLVPVCPNCHAMLHKRRPNPYSIEELKKLLR